MEVDGRKYCLKYLNFLDVNGKLRVEQKGCKKESRGTKNQLLKRKRHTNLGMVWIDYKKAYDMVPHSGILESFELVQVSDNILEFLKRSMAIDLMRRTFGES